MHPARIPVAYWRHRVQMAKAMLDADYATYWTRQGRDTTANIEFDLRGTKAFDVLLLQENIAVGQRVEKFLFEYNEAAEWKTVTGGGVQPLASNGYCVLIPLQPIKYGCAFCHQGAIQRWLLLACTKCRKGSR